MTAGHNDLCGNARVGREIGGRLDIVIRSAISRSRSSHDEAQRLLNSGFYSPSFVWSVRSVEIFVKEVCLLPIYFEETGDFNTSWRRVRLTFGSSKWQSAMKVVEETYGPFEEMITEDGENVWEVWKTVFVRKRGEVAHGRTEAGEDLARLAVQWADQFRSQFTMRLIAAGQHPLASLFVQLLGSTLARPIRGDE